MEEQAGHDKGLRARHVVRLAQSALPSPRTDASQAGPQLLSGLGPAQGQAFAKMPSLAQAALPSRGRLNEREGRTAAVSVDGPRAKRCLFEGIPTGRGFNIPQWKSRLGTTRGLELDTLSGLPSLPCQALGPMRVRPARSY